METNRGLRVLEVSLRFLKAILPLIFCVLVVFALSRSLITNADHGSIDPNDDGNTIQGTQTTCESAATNSSCVDDGVATTSTPLTNADYVTFSRTQSDVYMLETIPGVATATAVTVYMYHQEGNDNMHFQVSLWDDLETTQYWTTQNLANSQLSAWGSVSFTGGGTTLTQAQLDGLRVRTTCERIGGGQSSTCTNFALYAVVTYDPEINVTVSAAGTQQDLEVGTTSAHIGGSFVIKENTSTRDITGITITESGSVNAQTNLDNIELWYDLDTTAADNYNCSDQAYDGDETQFGTTDTDGFSAANGTAAFTSSGVTISTTATMCVYVVLDVLDGAAAAETLEVQISDPTTDLTATGGATIEPDTSVALSDTTDLLKTELEQLHYHWRNDDGLEADPGGATSATGGSEDTALSLSQQSPKRLRVEVSNEGNLTTSETVRILDGFTTGSTKAVSSGDKRLLLVGIHHEHSASGVDVDTVTYGGQTLTEVDEQLIATTFQNGMWVGYLDESGIQDALNTTIAVNWNGGVPDTAVLYSSAVFENVDQTNPLSGSSGNTATNASTIQPASSISVDSGDISLYFTISGATAVTHTPASGYNEGTEQDSGGSGSVAANAFKAITGSGTEQPIADWTTSQNRLAIVALNVQSAHAFRLEYAQKISTCGSATGWVDVGAAGGDWDMYPSSQLVEGNNTTNIALSIGGVTNGNTTFLSPNGGQRESTSETGNLSLTSSHYAELEYAITASTSASEGNTYCFRLTDQGTPLTAYGVYPEATISADLSVSATGTQKTTVDIPTANVYSGGGFVITDSTGSHSISSITISASGTIDYQNHIENIELWYETDTVAPYDCTGESNDGDETQYGTTDADGFSATGTATFFDPLTVTTTQGICLYLLYDVTASSTNGETLDIQITNPPDDIKVASGSISPAALVEIQGVTTFVTDRAVQKHYHWRNNNGGEDGSGATSATGGSEDTALTGLTKEDPIRLRMQVLNEGGSTTPTRQYRIEYAQKVSTCGNATGWTDVGAGGGDWDMFNTPNLTDGNDTTDISVSVGGVSNEAGTTFLTPNGGQKDTSSQTGSITLSGSEFVELEYSIVTTANAVFGATYCFRLYDALLSTELDSYEVYPEATVKLDTDFFVQRDVVVITGTSTTLVAGVDYIAPSASTSAFIRITNTHNTGAGPNTGSSNSNSIDTTAYIVDPSNITSSVTIARPNSGTANTRIAWEIIEYRGSPGGENEMIVRHQNAITYGSTALAATTSVISNIADDSDVIVFITGQFNPDTGRTDYNTGLSTAVWNAGTDTATFTRGEAGADAVIVSYAVVEFTGSNWTVQRVPDHTYTNAGSTETESITPVGSLSRAFIHAQKRVGANLDAHEDYGHEVWLSGIGQVSYRLDAGANTPSGHVSAVWVIENAQTEGDIMQVTRSNGSQTGGTAPATANINIGKTLDDITVSSIFINNSGAGTGRSFPEPMLSAHIISTTQYEIWVSDTADSRTYRTEIVEWPTAEPNVTQNHYYFFVNNNALDPTDAWPEGAGDIGEDAEITGLDEPLATGDSIRIRMSLVVSSAALPQGAHAYKLQYAERTSTCTAILAWHNLGNIGSTTALWRGTSTPIADGTTLNTLKISVSDVAGTFEEENNTAFTPSIVLADEDIEYDWAIENNGAPEKTDFCFRMVEADGTELADYNFHPVIRTVGYGAQSQDWRWFDDAENETPTSTLAATNTAPINIAFDNSIQLRWTLREVNGGTATNTKFRLQFSEFSDFSTSTDVVEIGECTDLSLWCYADGGGEDNATITTRTVYDADPCTAGSGTGCGTHNESGTTTSTFVHSAGEAKEFAFTIKHAGARVNRVYFFRAYDVANDEVVPLGDGESNPSLVTEGANLVFAMDTVASGTVLEGVTMDIDTTPVEISFGTLPLDATIAGAHRLAIDTNGTEGYQILLQTSGEFQSQSGDRILGVTGTNIAPTGWNTGCLDSASSCFGYHTSDDVLEGGSTRFTPLDSYARISTTTAEEIAYSSAPGLGETTDIIYRIRVDGLQPAGVYEMDISYIAIPVF